jgi:hypothetical protein
MSDKYSKETTICNYLWTYLKDQGFRILQLVAPGAQAALSVRFTDRDNHKKRTIFPDLIAVRDDEILIGEIKPNFSASDKNKLLKLRDSSDGSINIKDLARRSMKGELSDFNINYFLIHGDINAVEDIEISQLILFKINVEEEQSTGSLEIGKEPDLDSPIKIAYKLI